MRSGRGAAAASLMVLVLMVSSMSRPAAAQFERAGAPPTTGILLPGASLTLHPDAAGLELNPAELGRLRSWSLVLAHTELTGNARYLGRGTALFMGGRLPYLPVSLGFGAQLLRPGDDFGARYPAVGKLTLGLAVEAAPWFSFGLAGHLFVSPDDEIKNGLGSLDVGLTLRPTSWLALAVVVRDLTNPKWAGLPLQRRWALELGLRPLRSGRLSLGLGIEVGERRQDLSPRVVLRGEPWPGFTLFADAVWLRRDLDAADGRERLVDDVRFTAGLQIDFAHGGMGAAFVGGVPGLPGGAAAGASVWLRFSGDRVRSVSDHRQRVLLVEVGKARDVRSHWRRLQLLYAAGRERGIRAVLLKIDAGLGWAQTEDLRAALAALRKRGKRVIAYLYSGNTASYYLALGADHILLYPGGGLRMSGLSSTRMYFKAALDRLGIRAEIIKYRQYKTAPEPFTRTTPSPASNQVRDALLDDLAGRLHQALSARKGIASAAAAKALLDKGPFTAAEAKRHGLVDHLVYPDRAPEVMAKLLGRTLRLERPPRRPRRANDWGFSPAIAVVAVEGDIVGGKSRRLPLIGRRVTGAKSLVKLLASLAANPMIKAVVLRVASGGGSALAADIIWRAVQRLAKSRPVIASFGNVAASGGYFVAAPAKLIYAQPSTITGSIGIFAGKADVSGLLGKIGISVDVRRRGKRADVDSPYRAYTPEERSALQKKLGFYYQRFLAAVAKGRPAFKTAAQVDPVAGGRVWTGAQAQKKGLVDRLGGLWAAVTEARRQAGLRPDDGHRVLVLPKLRGGLLGRALKLFMGGRAGAVGRSPLLKKLLAPLRRLPASLVLGQSSTPQARLPYWIDIR